MNNPLRFVDPDGNSPMDVADSAVLPASRHDFLIGVDTTRMRIFANAIGKGAVAERSAAAAIVHEIAKSFHIEGLSPNIRVEKDPVSPTSGSALAYYTPTTDTTVFSLDLVLSAGGLSTLKTALTIVHETAHRAQFRGNLAALVGKLLSGTIEDEAYRVERRFLARLYAQGIVTKDEYEYYSKWISESEEAYKAGCDACLSMPALHETLDLMRNIYRKKTQPVIQGLWGPYPNPSGPMSRATKL